MTTAKTSPLLSVIVPTKDRYKYLKILIKSISGFKSYNLELIIQDNTIENSEIVKYLSELNPFQTKYFHDASPLSISENVDLAIQNSTGSYVCFIGDDDAILPNIVNCVLWMERHEVEAVRTAYIKYNWPDFYTENSGEHSSSIYYDKFSNSCIMIDPIDSLRKLAQTGFSNIDTLPKLYQGIVSRKALNKIKTICSTYTPGPSPDMACAVALAFVIKKFALLNIPVVLIGQSRHLGGGERALNGGVKNIDDVSFLPKNSKENWDKYIPKVWCSDTVWPESAIKAIEAMGMRSEVTISYTAIHAKFLYGHPKEYKLVLALTQNRLMLFLYLIYIAVGRNFRKYALQNRLTKSFAVISEASQANDLLLDGTDAAISYLSKKFNAYMEESIFNEIDFRR